MWNEAVMAYIKSYSGTFLEGPRKVTNDLIQDSWHLGRDLNWRPPEYKAGHLLSREVL
jgi:hypothetical protein